MLYAVWVQSGDETAYKAVAPNTDEDAAIGAGWRIAHRFVPADSPDTEVFVEDMNGEVVAAWTIENGEVKEVDPDAGIPIPEGYSA